MWSHSEDLPVEIERFLTTLHAEQVEFDRYLATVLFTDIVGSTEIGSLAETPLALAPRSPPRHRATRDRAPPGHGVDTAGDGIFATFDGPARAVLRAGHRGCGSRPRHRDPRGRAHGRGASPRRRGGAGIAVHVGARVRAEAGPPEVLVSQTVKDLVAGSGLTFEDAGEHELKGVPTAGASTG